MLEKEYNNKTTYLVLTQIHFFLSLLSQAFSFCPEILRWEAETGEGKQPKAELLILLPELCKYLPKHHSILLKHSFEKLSDFFAGNLTIEAAVTQKKV